MYQHRAGFRFQPEVMGAGDRARGLEGEAALGQYSRELYGPVLYAIISLDNTQKERGKMAKTNQARYSLGRPAKPGFVLRA